MTADPYDLWLWQKGTPVSKRGLVGPSNDPKIEILTRSECFDLLSRQSLGRVGASIDALPVILPIRFAVLDESILFRTVPGTKFDAATIGAVVAFQVDEYEPSGASGWSVLIQGKASEVRDPRERRLAEHLPMAWWDGRTAAGRLVRLESTTVTGRQFGPPDGR